MAKFIFRRIGGRIVPTKVDVRGAGYAKVWTWLGKKGKK